MNPLGSRLRSTLPSGSQPMGSPRSCTRNSPWPARPGDLHHAGTVVEAHHLGSPADQFLRVQAGAAGRVEDPLASHIAQQRQARGPVVVGIEKAIFGVAEELIRETSYCGSRPTLLSMPPILRPGSTAGNGAAGMAGAATLAMYLDIKITGWGPG